MFRAPDLQKAGATRGEATTMGKGAQDPFSSEKNGDGCVYGTNSEDIDLDISIERGPHDNKRRKRMYGTDSELKHYKMVYQLEKKYFSDQRLDKAILDPSADQNVKRLRKKLGGMIEEKKDNKRMIKGWCFFDDDDDEKSEKDSILGKNVNVKGEVSEKKVEEFFKCLMKVPKK